MSTATRRRVAIAVFTLVGAGAAFDLGARAGNSIDRSTRSVSIAGVRAGSFEHVAPRADDATAKVARQ